jgi:hypothetical protein
MAELIPSQVRDALAFMDGIEKIVTALPDEPEWGGGLRLVLPAIIPLTTDYRGDRNPVAWLIANDFNGYDITTKEPTNG